MLHTRKQLLRTFIALLALSATGLVGACDLTTAPGENFETLSESIQEDDWNRASEGDADQAPRFRTKKVEE